MKKEVDQRDGYRIVKRGKAESVAITIECPVCGCVSIDELDSISLSRSGACFDCESEIVDPNRKMWMEGWRPNTERVSEIVAKRLSSPHSRVHI